MNIHIDGLEDVIKKLEDLQKNVARISGEHSYSFQEIFTISFMKKYTDFESIAQMLKESGFVIENMDDFKKIPDDEWNTFVVKRTKFNNWESMMKKAATEFLKNQIDS